MREFIVLLVHSIATLVQLAKPGGLRNVVAESVLVRHHRLDPFSIDGLLIHACGAVISDLLLDYDAVSVDRGVLPF
jgi:hypothetical protein